MSNGYSPNTPLKGSPSSSTQLDPIFEDEEGVFVCCGFRPMRPARRRLRRLQNSISNGLRGNRGFYDANQVEDSSTAGGGVYHEDWDKESLFFFDAEQEPLGSDEYPIVFTNSLQHPKPDVSFDRPESLLASVSVHPSDDNEAPGKVHDSTVRSASAPVKSQSLDTSDSAGTPADVPPIPNKRQLRRYESEPLDYSKPHSQRFLEIPRRSTLENQKALEAPRVPIAQQGYPGGLTVSELAECQKFLRGLKTLDPRVYEQVFSLRDIEEEPYTICRWLRATKFDADSILQRLAENQEEFEEARDNDFYPDVSTAIGAPFSVFLSQYPFLCIGRAKNGCPVNYFQCGRINPEGILSITKVERLQAYFWWSFMYKFKEEIRAAQEVIPDFVRVEGINVLDLKGLTPAVLSHDTTEVIKLASQVGDFFPETLHCMLIINAPGFFSMFWGLIKKFIDPRTAARIQVFSNESKALAALQQLVDVNQIPQDYGGTNKTVKKAFLETAKDPLLRKQEVEFFHVRRRGKSVSKQHWTIQADEYIDIRAFTRSASGAEIVVHFNDKLYTAIEARGDLEPSDMGNGKSTSAPQSTAIVSRLMGPGTIEIVLQDLDDADKTHSSQSRGNFLLVGNVRLIESTLHKPATHTNGQ